MKIEVLCNDGSPVGVTSKSIWGEDGRIGVGGAELALLTMCEEWSKAGNEVVLYNNGSNPDSLFEHRNISSFDPFANHEVIIVFRSPNLRMTSAKGLKVWWSCDQYSTGNYKKFADFVDQVVCISPYHVNYFRKSYLMVDKVKSIDLPVRMGDFAELGEEKKIRNRFIFTSVPDRGLQELLEMWDSIKLMLPDASLTITSDYRLWGAKRPLNERYRSLALGKKDIKFFGALNRTQMLRELMVSDIYFYPCIYDELFCISCAEAQVAGSYPVTSDFGALSTTNMGKVIPLNPKDPHNRKAILEQLKSSLNNKDEDIMEIQKKAIERFSPDKILKQWDEKVFI
jgi:glycosyltransferase involved in cell wall biosynthesis